MQNTPVLEQPRVLRFFAPQRTFKHTPAMVRCWYAGPGTAGVQASTHAGHRSKTLQAHVDPRCPCDDRCRIRGVASTTLEKNNGATPQKKEPGWTAFVIQSRGIHPHVTHPIVGASRPHRGLEHLIGIAQQRPIVIGGDGCNAMQIRWTREALRDGRIRQRKIELIIECRKLPRRFSHQRAIWNIAFSIDMRNQIKLGQSCRLISRSAHGGRHRKVRGWRTRVRSRVRSDLPLVRHRRTTRRIRSTAPSEYDT